jgi:hypothetical protein
VAARTSSVERFIVPAEVVDSRLVDEQFPIQLDVRLKRGRRPVVTSGDFLGAIARKCLQIGISSLEITVA